MPFFDKHLPDVIERLQRGGKEVVLSTLALVMNEREVQQMHDIAQMPDILIEANDISVVRLLSNKPHMIGPYINTYNEGTLSYFADKGAKRIALPWELPMSSITKLGTARTKVEIEVQVFGRIPLAISARCYSARAHGLHKDGCRYVCGEHQDGMDVETLDETSFLAVNGLQTLSSHYTELSDHISQMQDVGVSGFRLSPHGLDMTKVSDLYRQVLAHKTSPEELRNHLNEMHFPMVFADGFLHGVPGAEFRQTLGQRAE